MPFVGLLAQFRQVSEQCGRQDRPDSLHLLKPAGFGLQRLVGSQMALDRLLGLRHRRFQLHLLRGKQCLQGCSGNLLPDAYDDELFAEVPAVI